jgi:hypothetical protein
MEIPCRYCEGAGEVTTVRADVIRRGIAVGAELRADRLSRGLSLREEAKRLGIRPSELSDRELGRGW